MALTTRKSTFSNPSKATRQQIPPFLDKLYHMVNDPSTESLIRWSETGDSFYVYDHERFAKEVLPHWFKHGNFGSFVRQLNNYGFRKVPHLQQGVLRSDGETEISHFENQYFQRGQSDLLNLIQRKKQAATDAGDDPPDVTEPVASTSGQSNGAASESTHSLHNAKGAVLDVNGIVNGIQAIKRHQHAISSELKELHQSNQGLWQEAFAARERHKKHHDTITRILKFLAGVFGQSQGGTGSSHNQEMPHDGSGDSSPLTAVIPRRQNRLMIENSVDLEGKATEVLNGMHLNMDDFMEPLDFEGGQANDGERFATIETPGSPGPSTPKVEAIPSPPVGSSPQAQRNSPLPPSSRATGMQSYLLPISNHDRPVPLTGPSQSSQPDFVLPSDTSSPVVTTNPQSDQMVQNAITSLYNNPSQLQRVMAALQSQVSMSIPSDSGADNAHVSRDPASSPPPFNFRPSADGQLSPNSTLSLLSAASNIGALSTVPGADDALYGTLAHNENQLRKSYKDSSEVEADVNALQGHLDSFFESLGLDSDATAALRGEQGNTDDDIVSSHTSAPTLPPHLADANPDFDFEAFLSQDFDTGGGVTPGGLNAAAQQNGAEQLGAFLDEVQSVSNESETTHASPAGDVESTDIKDISAKPPRKRKSEVTTLEEEELRKAPRTRKKR